jgi:glyoxylase-like metal-dependent hydrolase (beta-lactamase superfamily II)
MEVAAGVRRLGTRFTNFYLIEDRGKLTLIDAGLSRYWDRLVRELVEMGRTVEDIDAILITHHHPDHVGFAERARVAAGARCYSHQAEAALISGERRAKRPDFARQLGRPFVIRYLLHSLFAGGARHAAVAGLQTFGDGEVLDVPGRPQVIHVPGHTAGQCALLLESRGVLFCADALATFDFLTGDPGPCLPPDFVNADSGAALASLAIIEGIKAELMLPGHGEPWRAGVAEAVQLARLRALSAPAPRPTVAATA